jgi:hypothetical protein
VFDLITPPDIDSAYKQEAPGAALAGVTALIIPHISNQIAQSLRRDLDKAAYTVFPDSDGSRNIWLDAYPIAATPAIQVYYDTARPRVYGANTLLTNGEDYFVYENRGKIELVSPRAAGPKVFKVVYTGGLLTADATGVPDTIKIPAIIWGKRLLQQWDDLGVLNQSFSGASVSYPPMGWIPRDIQEMLGPERRRLML